MAGLSISRVLRVEGLQVAMLSDGSMAQFVSDARDDYTIAQLRGARAIVNMCHEYERLRTIKLIMDLSGLQLIPAKNLYELAVFLNKEG